MSIDAASRSLETYEACYQRVLQARREWAEAGQPLIHTYPNGLTGVAPSLKALRLCEADAARALEVLRVRHPGPPVRAVVEASLTTSPAEKLRLLKPSD